MNTRTEASSLLVPAGASRALVPGDMARWHAYLTVVKPRIVSLVVFTAVVACFAAAHGRPTAVMVFLVVLTGSLSAGGASAFNHYADRDIDACMERTRRRPLVSGSIRHASRVLAMAIGLMVAGVSLAASVRPALAAWEFVGAFVYAVVYTLWLKRRTPLNIVIGGAAGSAAVLGGWAAVDPALGVVPWLLAALVFFWTPAHFWSLALARSQDYDRAGVPMLPVLISPRAASWWVFVHIIASAALSLGIGIAGRSGPLYFALAIGAAVIFGRAGLHLLRRPDTVVGWQTFKLSGAYLGAIFLAVFLDVLFRAA